MTQGTEFVLGVDAGGTKTLLAIADRSGAVQFSTRAPTLDPTGSQDWAMEIEHLARFAAEYMPNVSGAALGLPFFGEIEAVSQVQRDVCAARFPMRHEVVNDVQVAFDGAFAGRRGVLLLAGTGSMAWAGDSSGTNIRVGGWGDAFGDEGSAYWIGREALSAGSRALDGRGPDIDFARALLRGLRLDEADLIGWSHAETTRRSRIASVAKVVSEIATVNETARSILERAGDMLYDHAKMGFERSGLPESAEWSYAGGVFSSEVVLDRVTFRIGRRPSPPVLPPIGGALLRAARLSGWVMDDAWVGNLARSLSCDGLV